MATLGDICTYISEKLEDDSNTAVPLTRVRRAVNDSIKYYKKRPLWFNEFEESITLSKDTAAFSFSTNTVLYLFKDGGLTINDVSNIRYPVRKVSSDKYDLLNSEQPGRPYVWTYRNDGFECYFYPDQDYTAIGRGIKDYTAFATDGTDDSETNDWLTEAETLIEYDAIRRLTAEYLQDLSLAAYYKQEVRDEWRDIKAFDADKQRTGTLQIHSHL